MWFYIVREARITLVLVWGRKEYYTDNENHNKFTFEQSFQLPYHIDI